MKRPDPTLENIGISHGIGQGKGGDVGIGNIRQGKRNRFGTGGVGGIPNPSDKTDHRRNIACPGTGKGDAGDGPTGKSRGGRGPGSHPGGIKNHHLGKGSVVGPAGDFGEAC